MERELKQLVFEKLGNLRLPERLSLDADSGYLRVVSLDLVRRSVELKDFVLLGGHEETLYSLKPFFVRVAAHPEAPAAHDGLLQLFWSSPGSSQGGQSVLDELISRREVYGERSWTNVFLGQELPEGTQHPRDVPSYLRVHDRVRHEESRDQSLTLEAVRTT
jgi:hypothetical protein